jgi:chromosome segregation ATPase
MGKQVQAVSERLQSAEELNTKQEKALEQLGAETKANANEIKANAARLRQNENTDAKVIGQMAEIQNDVQSKISEAQNSANSAMAALGALTSTIEGLEKRETQHRGSMVCLQDEVKQVSEKMEELRVGERLTHCEGELAATISLEATAMQNDKALTRLKATSLNPRCVCDLTHTRADRRRFQSCG